MKQEKAIELKNVAVHYRENKSLFKSKTYTALKDVSFDVYKGETLGIIGRNGAGKSTLLRLLAGIIKCDEGRLTHFCESVSLMALAAGFDPNLSGRQNALLSGMLVGHTKKEMLTSLDEIKAFSELDDFYEKPVKTYSSGMRAKLGFAVAMHTNPDVLLIDEVLAVGDINFKKKAEAAIIEKIGSNITVILVSHSQHQIQRLCQRVVWIENGIVMDEGNPSDVLQLYKMNMPLTKSGLFLDKFTLLNKNTEFEFEKLCICNGMIKFNCITFNRNNEEIHSLFIKETNSCSQPSETPRFGKANPNFIYAYKARFNNLFVPVNEKCILYAMINDEEYPIAEFNVKKV